MRVLGRLPAVALPPRWRLAEGRARIRGCASSHRQLGLLRHTAAISLRQVDFAAAVDDSLLEQMSLPKGNRRLISHEERGAVLGRLDGESYKCNAGGARPGTPVDRSRTLYSCHLRPRGVLAAEYARPPRSRLMQGAFPTRWWPFHAWAPPPLVIAAPFASD